MAWQFDNMTPVYAQIAQRIKGEIVKGTYPSDVQIPSVRQLATEAGVNPNTMQRAMTTLEEEGLLCAKGTLGRFVTSDKDVLSRLKKQVCRELARKITAEAESYGITRGELICSIGEYSDKEENT